MGIIVLLVIIIVLNKYYTKKKFDNSMYGDVSGNTLENTIHDKGNYGEYLTFLELEKLQGNNKILSNLYVPRADGSTTEIDLVMINTTGVYVFESKNYSGWIFGNEKDRYWTQTLQGGQKNKLYNPIWQNQGHINALKRAIKDVDNVCFYSYIIFSDRCKLKQIKVTTPHIHILHRRELLNRMKTDSYANLNVLSDEEIYKIYYELLKYCRVKDSVKDEHVERIRERK